MNLTPEQKNKFGKQIMLTAAEALEKGSITQAEMMVIARAITDKYESTSTVTELESFLSSLADNWEMFSATRDLARGIAEEQQTKTEIAQLQQQIHSQ